MLLKDLSNSKSRIKYKGITYTLDSVLDNGDLELLERYQQETGINYGIYLPNSIDYVRAYFTITNLDKVIVPIPIMAKSREIVSTVDYCELDVIITNTDYVKTLEDALSQNEYIVHIYNLDNKEFVSLGGLKRSISELRNKVDEDDIALMLHTSGTTSKPKRVMLSHKNLFSNIKSNVGSLGFNCDDKTLIILPMFFGYCNTAQFLTHLFVGADIVIYDGLFMPNKIASLVENENVTNFTCVPSMLLMLLGFRNIRKYDMSSLKYICFGGGNMPVDKLSQLISLFPHAGLVQTYGQTEASPRVTALLPLDAIEKIGSVGKPIPGVEVKIVDERGLVVKAGNSGELTVRGENVMKGYYKRPDLTEKAIVNGWLHTGDIARYDDDGYIYLVGRKKNIIISGGINIYPEEIEETLLDHAAVNEVVVYGEHHELLDEEPVAKVVLDPERSMAIKPQELIEFCSDRLSNYKVPRSIHIVEHLDKTKTGKIRRYSEE